MVRRPQQLWQLRTRALALGARTLVMGIVNLTPDSFSGDGLAAAPEQAVALGLRFLKEGAAILDLGGESTRPGSGAGTPEAISSDEEQDRLLPVLEALLREQPDVTLSVDTYRAATARAALAAGAEIINDVSGLAWDRGMAEVCAAAACGVVLMHTRGLPGAWKTLPPLGAAEVLPLVREGLGERMRVAAEAGIAPERTVLDPGYGFGKTGAENYALLAAQAELSALGRPLLAGLSRKSFLGRTLAGAYPGARGAQPQERDNTSLAAAVAAVLSGASLLRVHAVRATVEGVAVADALLAANEGEL